MEPMKPVETIRDGHLKASIWKNHTEKGSYFTTTFARSYKDEGGQWQGSQSFSRNDLLRIAELGRNAYGRIAELSREQAQTRESEPSVNDASREDFKTQRRQGRAQPNGYGKGY